MWIRNKKGFLFKNRIGEAYIGLVYESNLAFFRKNA